MNSQTYHPHRRDGRTYYGDTYATSRRRRSPVARLRRAWRRMFRLIVIAMCLLMLIGAVSVVPIIASFVTVTGLAK